MDSEVEMIIRNARGKQRPWGGVDYLTKVICAARDEGTRGGMAAKIHEVVKG